MKSISGRSIIGFLTAAAALAAIAGAGFSCSAPPDFRFAFLTDIHVQPEKRASEGFRRAIDTVNRLRPDFVITGGDLVMDVLGKDYPRADRLYGLYRDLARDFEMPVHNTMGNHEIFGIYPESGVNPDHPEFGEKMFEKRLGPRYYSFDHEGWHFMILDSIEAREDGEYIGGVDAAQMDWIQEDLFGVDMSTPIAISVHIPFITTVTQLREGSLAANGPGMVIGNAREVLTLFRDHNLKLVLQGHLHIVEEVRIGGITFLIGGAVCADWWDGPREGMEEGFVMVRVRGDDFEWEYIDYGWEVEDQQK